MDPEGQNNRYRWWDRATKVIGAVASGNKAYQTYNNWFGSAAPSTQSKVSTPTPTGSVAESVGNIASTAGTYISHAVNNAMLGREGEYHARLKDATGNIVDASFMGPGTDLLGRLERGDKPVGLADATAMQHDIEYAEAQTFEDEDWQRMAIRRADRRMLRNLQDVADAEADHEWNVNQGLYFINKKIQAEDTLGKYLGGKLQQHFAGPRGRKFSDTEQSLMKRARQQLQQQFAKINAAAKEKRKKRKKNA